MTQASLSAELPATIGPRASTDAQTSADSEAAMWLFGLTSSALLVASLLLLGLLASSSASHASVGGFMSATAVVTAAIALAALVYVVVAARRAGHLQSRASRPTPHRDETPVGLHIVPALPADLGRRRRNLLAEAQAARSRQANAIASAEAVGRRATRAVAPAPVMVPQVRQSPLTRPAPRVAPRQPVPGPVAQAARPVAPVARPTPPVFPHMPAPVVRPRTQVALSQLASAEIRARAMHPAVHPPMPPRVPVHR